MKIDVLIASLISVFFLGKATKDVEEKTQLASKTRTILYLVLAIVVGIFYYKTQQVATIYHYINIDKQRETLDKSKHCVDTITGIVILNHFSSAGINDNVFADCFQDDILNKGGVQVKMGTHIGDEYTYKTRKDLEHTIYYKSAYNNLGMVYQIKTLSTKVPSLFPFFFTYQDDDIKKSDCFEVKLEYFDYKKKPDLFKFYKRNHLLKEDSINEFIQLPFSNAYATIATLRVDKDFTDKLDKNYHTMNALVTCLSNEQNIFNIFTAADISQYVCYVNVISSVPVRALEVYHDTPIRANSPDSCVHVGTYSVRVEGKTLEDNMGNMSIHVELPTLANLQLIRSLILTTLITALVSLFFCNAYYLARRKMLKCKEEYIESINKDKLKGIVVFICILAALILVAVYKYIRILIKNEPIDVPSDWFLYYIAFFVTIVIITIIFILIRIKKCVTFKKQKSQK